jgi:hypothetical protein
MFADGTKSKDGPTFGAWLIMNTKDTYSGGPLHSDMTVDGIVYNYIGEWYHIETFEYANCTKFLTIMEMEPPIS